MIKEINKLKAIELLAKGKTIKIIGNENNYGYYIMNTDGSLINLVNNEIYEIYDFDKNSNTFYELDLK